MEDPRYWVIDNPLRDEPSLPEPSSCRDGEGPYVLPIVDEVYGGVIAWANTAEQAERIVRALTLADTPLLNPETDSVYLVVKTMSDDGIYVFATEDERDEFYRACVGSDDEDSFGETQKTDEPIITGQAARDIIAAEKGEN